MAYWGVVVKPGEPYAYESSGRGRLRITQATLGDLQSVSQSTIASSVGGRMPVSFCKLNSTKGTYRLELEYEEEQNVVFSVIGDSSVHLTGYYKVPDAAANVQALLTQSQEADDPETTHAHNIPKEHNAVDIEVHNDGTNQMVQQTSLNIEIPDNASPGSGHRPGYKEDVGGLINELGVKELKLGDCNTELASDGKEHDALDTEVCNDVTNQMVRQAALNIEISHEASPGSGHRPGYKEDVGGPIDKLGIKEQKLGDCNAEMASDVKERNALDTEVRNDGTNKKVQQASLNIEVSNKATPGSGHRPVYKEDVGGPSNEMKIYDLKSGDSDAKMASDGKKVKVKYIGMLEDGKVVDSADGHPAIFKFTLGAHKVIAGWEQGIQGMRVGGKRILIIPPSLAYKDKPQKVKIPDKSQMETTQDKPQKEKIPDEPQKEIIPANSWLIYEIELLKVWEPKRSIVQ